MKKMYSMIILTVIMSLLSGCNKSTSSEKVTLFLANNNAEGYPTSVACDEFARLVKERTHGRIIIETYHNSVLGNETTSIEQVQVGGIDFARVGVGSLAKFEDSLNALQLPYYLLHIL